MTASYRLGSVWGIPIGLHWSLFLVFALLVWSLGGSYFPAEYPDLAPATAFGLAALTGVLFFASILLHELGHAWVAVREGVPVRGITLFIFGGVAEIGEPTKSAASEFRIAAGGPLVSLALYLLFQGLFLLDGSISALAAPTEWLARINLLLLLFNLIPGYPLDGGRMLRAAVWHFTGNEQTGWRVAMASGQIVSFGFIAWGVFQIVQGNVANGIWIAFIGWFLQNATAAENASRTVQRQLSGTTVAQAMGLVDEPRVPSWMKLRQLVDDHVLAHGQGSFLVVDGDVPRGVLTLPEVTRVPQDRWDWTSVSEIMTPWSRLGRVAPTTDLLDALKLMESGGFGHLPVVEGDRLVGLLTRDEILRFLRLRAEVGPGI